MIVRKTNIYAATKHAEFKATTEREIEALLGVLTFMGVTRMPTTDMHFATDSLFRCAPIASIFTRQRFRDLMTCLHLNYNDLAIPSGEPRHDKLFKVRPLIKMLNHNFGRAYNLSREVSIDESMIAFKGRLGFKQYMPKKPIKWE